MKIHFIVPFFAAFSLTLPGRACAAQSAAGTYAASFLLIPSGVRSMGMGDAGVALAYGSNGAAYNPAGLAFSKNADFAFSNQTIAEDGNLNFIGYAQPVGFRGFNEMGGATLFTTLRHVDQGKIEVNTLGADGSLSRAETLTAGREYALGVGYAEYFLRGGFGAGGFEDGAHGIGLSAQLINSTLVSKYTAQGVGVNAGYLGSFSDFSVGLSVSNLGTKLKYINVADPLPVSVRGGIAVPLRIGPYLRLLLAYDTVHQEREIRHRAGAELGVRQVFFVRAGWRQEPEASRSGATIGVGGNMGRFFGEYAAGKFDNFNLTHRLLVGLRFTRPVLPTIKMPSFDQR